MGKLQLLPLETGVLEFGTVTKDKRFTTLGSEEPSRRAPPAARLLPPQRMQPSTITRAVISLVQIPCLRAFLSFPRPDQTDCSILNDETCSL